jgi:hypothetical protein
MMKQFFILLFWHLLFHSLCKAEGKDSVKISKNTIYIEAFGNGYLGSLNYERLFYKKNNSALSCRVGFITWHPLDSKLDSKFTAVPLELCFFTGNNFFLILV